MKTLKKQIIILSFLTSLLGSNLKAAEIVGATFEITEDVINSFINEQYNKIGFPRNISGNVSGVTYNITLQLPNVRLLSNQTKIVFGFRIESNVFNGVVGFEDDFSFSIPSINELSVKGVSQAFTAKVNSLNINSILKTVIIAAWGTLHLEVYPMNLAKKVEDSEWLVERSISVVDPYFSVSFNVVQEKLRIGLNTYLEGREYFTAGLFKEANKWWLKIGAGCQVEVKEIYIATVAGAVAHGTDLGTCPKKGGLSIDLNKSSLAMNVYIIDILYKTSNTFYVRRYKCIPTNIYVVPDNILN